MKQNLFYNKKPDIPVLKELAKELNSIPLPNIPESPHILLPPPEYSLTRNNFQIYSEEILANILHQENEQENPLDKQEDDMSVSKKHTMIGLKRRDNESRPILSKKRIRLSAHSDDKSVDSINMKIRNNKKMSESDMSNFFGNRKGSNKDEDEEYEDEDAFEHDEDSIEDNENFRFNNNDMNDDMNHYYNNFS